MGVGVGAGEGVGAIVGIGVACGVGAGVGVASGVACGVGVGVAVSLGAGSCAVLDTIGAGVDTCDDVSLHAANETVTISASNKQDSFVLVKGCFMVNLL